MNILDTLRDIFAGTPSVADLEAALERMDQAVDAAERAARDALTTHTDRTLELAMKNDLDAAAKSRRLVDAADARVADLRVARAQLAGQVKAARLSQQLLTIEERWKVIDGQFELDLGDTARLQQLLDDLASTCRRMTDRKLAIWQALPERPKYFPPTFTTADLLARIDAYLSGASSGLLGDSPNAFVASRRPDLVSTTEEAHRLLLSARTVPATTTT